MKIIAQEKKCRWCSKLFLQSVSEVIDGAESFQSVNSSDICRKCLEEKEGQPFTLRESAEKEFLEYAITVPSNAPIEDFREIDRMAAKLGFVKAKPSRPRQVKPKSAKRSLYQ